MFSTFRDAVGTMPWLVLALSQLAHAACECGYSVNASTSNEFAFYTDLIENDWLHTDTNNITSTGWIAQEYSVNAADAHGNFGKRTKVGNVDTNPLKDKFSWSGETENGGDPGLRITVRGDHSDGYVSGGEVVSLRDDIWYGSFRVGMKLTGVHGTVGSMFWYWNNSQELDLELLSKDFNNSQGAVNFVMHTPESWERGGDASNTTGYRLQPLPFRPDEQFHEYRFDWSPGKVDYYVDGQWVWQMNHQVPDHPGSLHMNHWSNGNPQWSTGPPDTDAIMTVSYVKAYFNTSNKAHNDGYRQRWANWNASQVCQIPDQKSAPDTAGPDGNKTANTYFFSYDGTDKVPGQDVVKTTRSAASSVFGSTSFSLYVPVMVVLFSWAFAI